MSKHLDARKIKHQAAGRWVEILQSVCGLAAQQLNPHVHSSCPSCGGNDRFRAFDDVSESGGLFCNQCHSEKNSDGFASVQWLRNCSFREAVRLVADAIAGTITNDSDTHRTPKTSGKNKTVHKSPERAADAFAFGLMQSFILKAKRKPDSIWMYHNADGSEAGAVLRWNLPDGSKTFGQLTKVDGGWICGGMPSLRPMYKLPSVIAVDAVWIVEGEKAADAAVSLGLTATTPSQGAQSPKLTDWRPLAGKRVVIIPDNDESGEKFAREVVTLIRVQAPDAVVEVKRLKDDWPEIPEKGDIFDWQEQFDSADVATLQARLNALPDKLSEYVTEKQHQPNIEPMVAVIDGEPWPALVPIAGVEPETMTADDFPPCVAEIVQAIVDQQEVPVELPGLMALGIVATASQKKYQITSHPGHVEPLNLFVCPAMPPGERKTAVVKAISKPLTYWENMERGKLMPRIRELESHRKTAEKRIENLRNLAARSKDSIERDDLQREIDAIERELPVVPPIPKLWVDDCTPEKVAPMLSRHGERLAVISDEGGIFDIIAGRYNRGVPNLDVFLQGHAGSPVRVDRGSRDAIELQNPCLTVAVCCQPFVLSEMGDNKAFRGRGLVDRFLFAIPKSRLGFRKLRTREISQTILDRWNRLICSMLDREQHEDDDGHPQALTIYLSPDAYRLWRAEYESNEFDMRPGSLWETQTGWASKYPGAVLRIAGGLHCAICADSNQAPDSLDVPESTMRFAVTLGQKIKSHTLHAFGMMALTDDQKIAHKITDWIKRDGITEFTGRECSIHCNSAGSVKDLEGALELLDKYGWIRKGPKRKPEGGGRPSEPFGVNPQIAKLNDKTDETRQPDINQDVSSVSSAELPMPAMRPSKRRKQGSAESMDDTDYSFPSDKKPF